MIVRVSLQPVSVAAVDENPNASFNSMEAGAGTVLVSVESGLVHKHCSVSEDLLMTVTAESLKDFQWYFEQYIINEPFAYARARTIARRIRDQGRKLLESFLQPVMYSNVKAPEHIVLEVRDRGAGEAARNSIIHEFFWEILEDTSLWRDVFHLQPRQVNVIRVYENQNSAPMIGDAIHTSRPSSTEAIHVLAITARPSYTKDVPHRLITRSISAAIETIRNNSNSQATLDIVRPGTFKAFESHIRRHSYGHFDVVHLDLHGDSDGQGYEDWKCFVMPDTNDVSHSQGTLDVYSVYLEHKATARREASCGRRISSGGIWRSDRRNQCMSLSCRVERSIQHC